MTYRSSSVVFVKTICLLFAVLPGLGLSQSGAAEEAGFLPQKDSCVLRLATVKEPSGICYHAIRGTLFVVDDTGEVCEFKPDGVVVKQKVVRSADFEGITCEPSTGLLYIAIEGEEALLEVDPETLEPLRTFSIPRVFGDRTVMKQGGQGVEAVTFVPDAKHPHGGTFFVANQSMNLNKKPEDISAVFEVELPLKAAGTGHAVILRYFNAQTIDISALHYDEREDILYAVSDSTDRLIAYDRKTGGIRRSWILPGENQEGLTVSPDGVMFIAQDSGGVLKLNVDREQMHSRSVK